jgi:hypothetical protein
VGAETKRVTCRYAHSCTSLQELQKPCSSEVGEACHCARKLPSAHAHTAALGVSNRVYTVSTVGGAADITNSQFTTLADRFSVCGKAVYPSEVLATAFRLSSRRTSRVIPSPRTVLAPPPASVPNFHYLSISRRPSISRMASATQRVPDTAHVTHPMVSNVFDSAAEAVNPRHSSDLVPAACRRRAASL